MYDLCLCSLNSNCNGSVNRSWSGYNYWSSLISLEEMNFTKLVSNIECTLNLARSKVHYNNEALLKYRLRY